MKEKFLEQKKTTGIFAMIAFLSGYIFLDNSVTGNAILKEQPSLNLVSLIGLGLIICSLLLAYHTFKK